MATPVKNLVPLLVEPDERQSRVHSIRVEVESIREPGEVVSWSRPMSTRGSREQSPFWPKTPIDPHGNSDSDG